MDINEVAKQIYSKPENYDFWKSLQPLHATRLNGEVCASILGVITEADRLYSTKEEPEVGFLDASFRPLEMKGISAASITVRWQDFTLPIVFIAPKNSIDSIMRQNILHYSEDGHYTIRIPTRPNEETTIMVDPRGMMKSISEHRISKNSQAGSIGGVLTVTERADQLSLDDNDVHTPSIGIVCIDCFPVNCKGVISGINLFLPPAAG